MPGVDLPTLGRSFARLKARWARHGRLVRELGAKADKIANARSIARLRGSRRQAAALEVIRDEIGYHAAWARWSATGDELADLVAEIMPRRARTAPELVVKFDALLWMLLSDGAVLDRQAELQARRFGRELRRMASAQCNSAS